MREVRMNQASGPQMVHILRLQKLSPVIAGVLKRKQLVLKTGEVKASVGSNPTLSVAYRA